MSNILGEWWLTDSGSAIYADDNTCDINHMLAAQDHLSRLILGYADVDLGYDDYIGELQDYMEQIAVQVGAKDGEEVQDYLLKAMLKNKVESAEEMLKAAWTGYCVTEYAINNLGWARLCGNLIEIASVKYLSKMVDGLIEVVEEQLDDEDDPEFTIYIRDTNRRLHDVPLSVLERKDLQILHKYLSHTCSI